LPAQSTETNAAPGVSGRTPRVSSPEVLPDRRVTFRLAAPRAGEAEAQSALPPAELRVTLGYADYDAKAKAFIVPT